MANKTLTEDEQNAILFQAMQLLTDNNLEWSEDMNAIRPHLCNLFIKAMGVPTLRSAVLSLAAKIVSDK